MHSGLLLCFFAAGIAMAQPSASAAQPSSPGQRQYDNNCSVCHGGDGNGGELGPPIAYRVANRSDEELANLIHSGIPSRGMPAFKLATKETSDLVAFLRTLRPQRRGFEAVRKSIRTVDGKTLQGLVIGESSRDM